MITLDHIAVGATSLEAGAGYMHAATGVAIPKGGEHPQMGTHNLLTSFGDDTYLEVITQNPNAPAPDRPRWFGLDTPPAEPCLHAWVLRTDDLSAALSSAAKIGIDLGTATPFQRDTLRWQFSLRGDGQIPLSSTAPQIIQWETDGPHPATKMTDLGLRLKSLTIQTPHANALNRLLDALGLSNKPQIIQSSQSQIIATLRLPDGGNAELR